MSPSVRAPPPGDHGLVCTDQSLQMSTGSKGQTSLLQNRKVETGWCERERLSRKNCHKGRLRPPGETLEKNRF